MTTAAAPTVPQEALGNWRLDPVHSEIGFSVRHMGITKVRGQFTDFRGEITVPGGPSQAHVSVTIQTSSFETGNSMRDEHIKSADFLDVATYPTLEFESTGVEIDAEEEVFQLHGNLTIHGVTRPVTLTGEFGGVATSIHDEPIIGFSASTKINRNDFGVTGGPASAVVSDNVTISLDIQAKK